MTRLIIFGDLHANWEAWLALQQAECLPEGILCLGDIIGYGPDPKRCLDAVRANATYVIRGRHDLAVGLGATIPDHDLLAETWAHARSVLSPEDCRYLAALPADLTVALGGVWFHLARLWPDDSSAETFPLLTIPARKLEARFAQIQANIILLGGAHFPAMRQVGQRLFIAPGSLGLPRYGVPDPTYAVWQDGDIRIHHLHYQPEHTARKLSLLPLAPENVAWLQSTLRTGDRG